VASKIPDSFRDMDPDALERGVARAARIVDMLGRDDRVIAGTATSLRGDAQVAGDVTAPALGDAARAIIDIAMRDDDRPLFYCAGGGLADLATAYLHEPRIAGRLTLVWIGGPGYDVDAGADERPTEFNTTIDPVAAGVVFASPIEIWQVPETTYAQCLVSWAELQRTVAPVGPLAAHLVTTQREFAERFSAMLGVDLGETVVLGDSPLALLTALRGPFRAEPSSSPSQRRTRRAILPDASYGAELDALPPVRVFTAIDVRLMLGDLIAKLRGVGA
ncbi:MAG TPA: nucleoside hydrolase, partial [Microbacterium sp.]|nr:nucleoside hydrolase [Microbacterium sp.]